MPDDRYTRRQVIGTAALATGAVAVGSSAWWSLSGTRRSAMIAGEQNKRTLREFVHVVWEQQNLSALPTFWTADCINHASPGPDNVGLDAIRVYHQGFVDHFLPAFSHSQIEYVQQVAEGDRVVSQMLFTGDHTATAFDKPPTGRRVSLTSIRIDRFVDGKIAEHWSVADLAGLLKQLDA